MRNGLRSVASALVLLLATESIFLATDSKKAAYFGGTVSGFDGAKDPVEGLLDTTNTDQLIFTGPLLAVLLFVQEAPLPPLETFKDDIGRIVFTFFNIGQAIEGDLRSIEELKHYTYTETARRIKLDSTGKPHETETNLYQVIQGPEPWQYYRKHMAKDGVSLSATALEKQDREQKKREQKLRAEMDRAAAKEAQKKKAEQKSSPAPPETQTSDVFQFVSTVYDIHVVRRELLDGYSTVLLTFTPKPGLKHQNNVQRLLQHIAIRAWVTEQGHQPVKLENKLVDAISFGFGALAKIQEGSLLLERRMIAEGVWAPVKAEGIMKGRLLLVKGMKEHQITEYSDFRKYSVETFLNVLP